VTDWPFLLRLAATRFHIAPDAFWRLSVKEWAGLTAAQALDALGRKDFDALMAAHPDRHPSLLMGEGPRVGVSAPADSADHPHPQPFPHRGGRGSRP